MTNPKNMNPAHSLPEPVLSKAYEFNSEYAWRPDDLPALADVLRQKHLAVLGGEVWLKTDDGPNLTADIYHWTIERRNKETWDVYVDRTLIQMLDFAKQLSQEPNLKGHWNEVYLNLQMSEG